MTVAKKQLIEATLAAVAPKKGATPAPDADDTAPARERPKRRIRSPHPGVKLKRRALPSGAVSWRAVFVDPDTGRSTYVTLDPHDARSAETRRKWAIGKSKALSKRRAEIESGAPRTTGTALSAALNHYFEAHTQLRERTRKIYRAAADKLEDWAPKAGVRTADDLTRAKLLAFREELVKEPKRAPERGPGKRWNFAATVARRSPVSVNQELRACRTVLGYLLDLDLLPRLTRDDLRRGLKMLKAPREAPEFLRPPEVQRLIDAALKHDAETFAETRAEHAGDGRHRIGTTPRYAPVAPFLVTVLLCGFRAAEALELTWNAVDLTVQDADANTVGEIRLRGAGTKTGHARTVGLDVCPELRKLLTALRERAGEAAYVFGGKAPMSRTLAEATRKRLIADYDAPKFSWQLLRSTCATVQCNAPSLWGTAAPFVSAKRLGHAVAVSEKRYAGQLAISREARTLEAAMGIEQQMATLLARYEIGAEA